MLKVNSEINKLKKVLLHRPGAELKILNEDNKQDYLFDEIPDLEVARKEHDIFSSLLKNEGVEVYYLIDLMKEVFDKNNIKDTFIKDFLYRANCCDENIYNELINIKDNKELILKTMSGLDGKIQALPNLYFTRDPFTIIGGGIALYNMHTNLRKREVIYGEYINKYHPDFNGKEYYNININEHIEGGDVLLLSCDTICVGVSQRTTYKAASILSESLIKDGLIKQALIIKIPDKRACMHLDTVFTRFDINKFVIYKEIYDSLKLSIIDEKGLRDLNTNLETTLASLLHIEDIKLLICDDALEQWNDACNTLCIEPNKIIVYDGNIKMNKAFKKVGTSILTIPTLELVKGRGGTHCMSMPLLRD